MKTENEIWKEIKDFPIYEISNTGNLRMKDHYVKMFRNQSRMIKQHIININISNAGYAIVQLRYNGKSRNTTIHRLVAETFIPNPYNLKEVNHKDENKLNNAVDNLEWCTRKYNMNYGTLSERLKHFHKEQTYVTVEKPIMKKKVIVNDIIFNNLIEASEHFHITAARLSQIYTYGQSKKYKVEYKMMPDVKEYKCTLNYAKRKNLVIIENKTK